MKPIAMIDVAAELCMTAVTPMPSSMPRMRVLASFSSVFSSLAPAKLSIAPPSTFIPYRNKPMPPIRLIQL